MKKRTLALLAALVLCVTGVVGGTLAWLTDTSDPVVNTFSPSDITITLEETTTEEDYKMIPGWTIAKNPKVTVEDGSVPCWLFVKLEKSANFDQYMNELVPENGWEKGDGTDIPADVWYRNIDTDAIGETFSVLANDQVSVKDSVTKQMMNDLTADNYPTLTVTAYASQLYKNNTEKFTAAEAWNNVPKNNP